MLSGGGLIAALPPTPTAYSEPQVSPSMPLTFILPSCGSPIQPATEKSQAAPAVVISDLLDTVQVLHQSGWYYDNLSYQEAHELLKDTAVGTFLVRNSSDPGYLFSLSVQTERGPTSVRIYYDNKMYRLDAQPHLRDAMPKFPCIVELVNYYVKYTKLFKHNAQVWVDSNGKWYSSITLTEPLRKKREPPSLKHFARLTIHRALDTLPKLSMMPPPHTQLGLPTSLTAYLSEYPYSF